MSGGAYTATLAATCALALAALALAVGVGVWRGWGNGVAAGVAATAYATLALTAINYYALGSAAAGPVPISGYWPHALCPIAAGGTIAAITIPPRPRRAR